MVKNERIVQLGEMGNGFLTEQICPTIGFFETLAIGRSTCFYTEGRSSVSEPGNVQVVATVYFSKL
jgi:hypothetical protein